MLKHLAEVLNLCVKYSIKSPKIIWTVILIEFYILLLESIGSLKRILNFYFNRDEMPTLKLLDHANPFFYFRNAIDNNCVENDFCSFPKIPYIVISCMLIFLLILFHFYAYRRYEKKNFSGAEQKENLLRSYMNYICVNLIDVIFKLGGIFIFYFYLREAFIFFNKGGDSFNLIFGIIVLIIFATFYFLHIKYVCLVLQFQSNLSYHYDSKFSNIYDYVFVFLKFCFSIQTNFLHISQNLSNVRIIFFDFLILSIIIAFTCNVLWKLFYNNKSIFLINKNLNLFRFFLLIFNSFVIIIFLIFNFVKLEQIFILFSIIIILFLSIIIVLLMNRKIIEIYLSDEKLVYQMVHFLNIFYSYKFEIFQREVGKFQSLHLNKCYLNVKDCKLCETRIIEEYLKNIVKQVKNLKKNFSASHTTGIFIMSKKHFLTSDENFIFDFIKLIYAGNGWLGKNQAVSIIYKTKNFIEKNTHKSGSDFYNLIFYFSKINKLNDLNVKRFDIVKKYDNTITLLDKSIQSIKEVLMIYEANMKKDFYPIAALLNKNKTSILDNFQNIMLNKNFYIETYSLMTSRFIYEKIFNVEIEDNEMVFDFENRGELVTDHFKKDKVIWMNYNVNTSSITLSRVGRHFISLKGQQFEELFPNQMRSEATKKFIFLLKKSVETFTFEFLIEEDEASHDKFNKQSKMTSSLRQNRSSVRNKFMSNLSLNCTILRSLDMRELYILADYEITQEEILIFEEILDLSDIHIVGFSESVSKVLFLNSSWFRSSKGDTNGSKIKNYMIFSEIFQKSESSNKNGKQGEYVLDYRQYFENVYKKEIKVIQELFEDEDIQTKFKELESLAEMKTCLNIRMSLKYEIKKDDSSSYKVFTFKILNRRMNNSKGQYNRDDIGNEDLEDEELNNSDVEDISLIDRRIINTPTSSSAASFTGYKANNYTMSMNLKRKSQQNVEENIKRFTLLTIWTNVFLIVYCAIFTVFGLLGAQDLHQLYQMKNIFIRFEHGFYQTSLSLFYNVGVYKENTLDDTDYTAGGYWSRKAHPNITISMGDYANSELSVKLDLFKNQILSIQNFVYSSSFANYLTEIINFRTPFYSLASGNEEITVNTHNVNFIDSLNMFINSAKAADFPMTNPMIYIFNFKMATGDYDFSSVWYKNLNSTQKAVYEIIMNYPNFNKNYHKIASDVENIYKNEMDKIFNTYLYLSFILMGSHSILILISIVIINFLKKTTRGNNLLLIDSINSETIKFITLKLSVLHDINQLYKEDPYKSHYQLKKANKEFSKKMENLHRSKKNIEGEVDPILTKNKENKLEFINSKIWISNLVDPLIGMLLIIFSLYYAYSVGFFFIFNDSYTDLLETSEYFTSYTTIDSNMMNYILLLQTIMFSNQTDVQLGKHLQPSIYSKEESQYDTGYILRLMEETHSYKMKLEGVYVRSNKFAKIKEAQDNYKKCNYLFTKINDTVIEKQSKLYFGNSLKLSLEYLCVQYPMMKSNNFNTIIEEVNFSFLKLMKRYYERYGDYVGMKLVNDEDQFFDAFTICVMIVRPLQTHIINTVISDIVNDTEQSYLLIIIFYLICNICVDIFIFLIIYFKLIRRVFEINNDIKCLTKCISI